MTYPELTEEQLETYDNMSLFDATAHYEKLNDKLHNAIRDIFNKLNDANIFENDFHRSMSFGLDSWEVNGSTISMKGINWHHGCDPEYCTFHFPIDQLDKPDAYIAAVIAEHNNKEEAQKKTKVAAQLEKERQEFLRLSKKFVG